MFQFWNEWKRKEEDDESTRKSIKKEQQPNIIRSYSMASDNSTVTNWSIDWNQKRALSFKEDYVSFPSLEPPTSTNNEVPCSN